MSHGSPSYEFKGEELRTLRENAGLSLRKLSAKCAAAGTPVHFAQISSYEIGRHNPRPATLAVLVQVLDCKPEDLVHRKAAA